MFGIGLHGNLLGSVEMLGKLAALADWSGQFIGHSTDHLTECADLIGEPGLYRQSPAINPGLGGQHRLWRQIASAGHQGDEALVKKIDIGLDIGSGPLESGSCELPSTLRSPAWTKLQASPARASAALSSTWMATTPIEPISAVCVTVMLSAAQAMA